MFRILHFTGVRTTQPSHSWKLLQLIITVLLFLQCCFN